MPFGRGEVLWDYMVALERALNANRWEAVWCVEWSVMMLVRDCAYLTHRRPHARGPKQWRGRVSQEGEMGKRLGCLKERKKHSPRIVSDEQQQVKRRVVTEC
jgi:hypothetical protein